MEKEVNKFLELRDFLLNVKSYDEAYKGFNWPHITKFNWALDYFDLMARGNENKALIYCEENSNEKTVSFDEMSKRSSQVANFLNDLGLQKGNRVMIMMETSVEIFEIILGIMKAGGSIIPAATLLSPKDIGDRIKRGDVKFIIAHHDYTERIDEAGNILETLTAKICVKDNKQQSKCSGDNAEFNWVDYSDVDNYDSEFSPSFITYSTDDLFLFFTSGTTAKPKLVMHPHYYPIGHLTTMYWLDVQPTDIHYNISAPGWAKFAWSSFFSPWNAMATILTIRYSQFDSKSVLEKMAKYKVTSLCAPLSVWKLFLLEDLSKYNLSLKKMVSAGEPLNPEIVNKAKEAVGLELREGYGQTETTGLVATFKGMLRKDGAIGKVAPGFEVKILNSILDEVEPNKDGQIAVSTYPVKPLGLLTGYDDEEKNKEIFKGGWYLTGDTAYMDEDGYIHFIGRVDDVFKSLDYRISPFEVESEIIEHPAVLEVGVIPTVDEKDRIVPKAFIVLKPDFHPSKQMALEIFRFIRDHIAPYKRPRSLEFMEEFPKTISAKIMRKDLRAYDESLKKEDKRGQLEFFEIDFARELNLRRRK
ncbi:acetyl-coenzyme A synthetase [bacterium BMS3Abin05]|nr:acetyl-coenzyme A synthetase [bacterium BMS3Abin05]